MAFEKIQESFLQAVIQNDVARISSFLSQNEQEVFKNGDVVYAIDSEGFTPLYYAVKNKNIALIRAIFKNSKDASIITAVYPPNQISPLQFALNIGVYELYQVFLNNIRLLLLLVLLQKSAGISLLES